ncbi:unnamed protein product [Brachionus calyciflorus]|uniref:G-protein coupled receptors family 1 profile domain-containing protein n=1 Tax=Brachionus calyciflorus TaxID=104777 RepID=A0A814FH82_9BILA|nr:unnamed protein product [Brachionus calyciflorus]
MTTTSVSQKDINEELMNNTWDYATEIIFIVLIGILTLPANIFLFYFYMQKIRRYKKLKHLSHRYVRIANSFHTYMIEMCSFDTIIVIYLILNTFFQFLYYLKKSEYESVYDISNFTCKFFIYILRISGAMSNYLVFLLSLNRSLLILFKYKPMQLSSHRLCLNTKYLTLFLFCICTIANVFRLELLNLNNGPKTPRHLEEFDIESMNMSFKNPEDLLQVLLAEHKQSECGPNIGSISFTISDSTNALFWSIIIYNIIFTIIPAVGNLVLSIYLIKKRSELKQKLVVFIEFLLNNKKVLKSNDTDFVNNYEEISEVPKLDAKKIQLSEFQTEFLKTCTPCIAFSLTHVLLFLPYSIIELINQINPSLSYMTLLQYMTYIRYFFYCSKFYLLFFVSFRFRRDFRKFFINRNRRASLKRIDMELKRMNDMNKINSVIASNGKIN